MTGIHETAYPRLKTEISHEELVAIYTPSQAEIEFVFSQYRQAGPRTFLLIQLKLLQRLGYFLSLNSIPSEIIEHICLQAKLRPPLKRALLQYDQSGSKSLHHQRLRAYLGIRIVDKKDEQWLEAQAMQAAQTKQELPDIINVLIEELVQRRFELPGFTFLFRLSRRCRNTVNDLIYKSIAGDLNPQTIERLDNILATQPGQSIWDSLKREPKQPNVKEVTNFLQHIDSMIAMAHGLPNTQEIAATKREQLTLEARALDLSEMRALKPLKRYALAILLIQTQLEKAMDDIAEIFIKSLRSLHNSAEERLRQYHLQQAEQTELLIGQFREVLSALNEDGTGDQRIARVDESLCLTNE